MSYLVAGRLGEPVPAPAPSQAPSSKPADGTRYFFPFFLLFGAGVAVMLWQMKKRDLAEDRAAMQRALARARALYADKPRVLKQVEADIRAQWAQWGVVG